MTRGTIARCAGRVACHCEECSDAALRPSQRQLVPIARLSIEVNMTNDDVPYRYRRAGYTMPIVVDPDLRSSTTRFPDLPTAHRDAETLPRHTQMTLLCAARFYCAARRFAALRPPPRKIPGIRRPLRWSPVIHPRRHFRLPSSTNEPMRHCRDSSLGIANRPHIHHRHGFQVSPPLIGTLNRSRDAAPPRSGLAKRRRLHAKAQHQVREPASRQPKQAARRPWSRPQAPAASAKASMPMNRLMVKPMPQSIADAVDLRATSRRPAAAPSPRRTVSQHAAEHADLLAEEQAERDAQRHAARAASPALNPAEGHAGIGEAEDRQDARNADHGAAAHVRASAAARRHRPVCRHAAGAGSSGRAARPRWWRARPTEHRAPRARRRARGTASKRAHAGPVQPTSASDDHGRAAEHRQRQIGGIEHGDDQHRAEIVDDGERRQEHLQRHRHARAEQRQDAEREGDVGGGRDGPAPQGLGRMR